MRFTRDKRGYENTYVVHTPRRRARGRPRILYWFRTPPGVRVGRAALDAEAIRLIEEHHPQIHFDWPQILNGEEEPAPPEPNRRPEAAVRAVAEPVPAAVTPEPAARELAMEQTLGPAHARLGSEGLARLRARYADVIASITRRTQDEQRRQQLTDQAERLNPDSWVTDDEVVKGLEAYEAVLASLRDVVGRRRRRKRSRPAGPGSASAVPGGAAGPVGVGEGTDALQAAEQESSDPGAEERNAEDED